MDEASGPVQQLPRRRARRRRLLMLMAAMAVTVLLLGGTEWAGPYLHPGTPIATPGGAGRPDLGNATFLADLTPAVRWTANASGGPWQLVGGFSVTGGFPTRLPLDGSEASDCPLHPTPYP